MFDCYLFGHIIMDLYTEWGMKTLKPASDKLMAHSDVVALICSSTMTSETVACVEREPPLLLSKVTSTVFYCYLVVGFMTRGTIYSVTAFIKKYFFFQPQYLSTFEICKHASAQKKNAHIYSRVVMFIKNWWFLAVIHVLESVSWTSAASHETQQLHYI